jgi:hypothetical protein
MKDSPREKHAIRPSPPHFPPKSDQTAVITMNAAANQESVHRSSLRLGIALPDFSAILMPLA